MRVSLLGSLQVDGASAGAVLGAAKERSLLAALALRPGTVVATDVLIASLWGEDPPASARKTLQTYVWNLRQLLGNDVILTDAPGYALSVAPEDVDVVRFRALIRRGEVELADGHPHAAGATLREAAELWRGEPFGGVAPHTGLAAEGVRLKEEYLSALESRITADLAAGTHAEIVAELDALTHAHPFRERFWGYLMVALYRCGRQVDALATYQRVRERLVEELGLEPGGELRRLQTAILNHDPSVAATVLDSDGDDHRQREGAGERRGRPPGPVPVAHPTGVVRSPVRYARSSDGVNVAFQVAGHGPIDILAIPGFVTHLDIWWNAPTDGLVRELTSIGRLISFDKRGMGLSDRPEAIDAIRWVDDALAVLDAAGAKDVVVLGISAGAPTAIRLAAMHPDRVRGLVVFGGGARTIAGPGYEIGHERELLESFADNLERGWGTGVAISSYAPSRAKQPHVREYWARYQQLSAAPAAAMRFFWATVETDVIDLLASVSAPTLVLHPERDLIAPVAWGRFVADRIEGAEFVALDSDVDLICVSDVIDELAEAVGDFIERRVPVRSPLPGDLEDRAVGEPSLVTVLSVRLEEDGAGGRMGKAVIETQVTHFGGSVVGDRPGSGLTATFAAPGRAVECARRLRVVGGSSVRAGVHLGECLVTARSVDGDAVDIASALADAALPGEVIVTRTVCDVVASAELRRAPTTRSVDVDDRSIDVVAISVDRASEP